MDECRMLVEQIIRVLANSDALPPPDELRVLSDSYARCCHEVNDYLDRCEAWLVAGESSEAIRIADTFHVIEIYNLLRFPQYEDWSSLCRALGFAPPPALAEAQALALLRAYEVVNLMGQLLDRHRLGALKLDPIKDRLNIVYQLEKCEPQNIIWSEIIPEYESLYFEEMEQQFAALPSTMESKPMVDELLKELRNNPWRTMPPEQLTNRVTKRAKKLHQQSLFLSLEQIVNEMREAYSAMDAAKCAEAIDNWNCFIQANRIPLTLIPTQLVENTRDPMSWYAEIERQNELTRFYEEKQRVFEESLQYDEDITEIVGNYSAMSIAAENANQTVPDSMIRAYRVRVGLLDLQKKRKLRIYVIGILTMCILIGLGLFLGVRHSVNQKKLRIESQDIKTYLDRYEATQAEGKVDFSSLDEAGKYIGQLSTTSPSSLASPMVREQVSRYEVLRNNEERRLDDFKEVKKMAEDLIGRGELNQAAVERIERLAASDEEKLDAINVRKQFELDQRRTKAKRDGQYRALLTTIADKVTKLENMTDIDASRAITTISEIEKNFVELDQVAEGVTTPLLDNGDKLRTRTQTLKELFERENNVAMEYNSLVDKIGSPTEFISGLKEISKKHPGTAVGKEADSVVSQFSASANLEEWNRFVRTHADSWQDWSGDPATAKRVFDDFEKFEGAIAFVPEFLSLQAQIKRVRTFTDTGGRIQVVSSLDKMYSRYSTDRWLLLRKEARPYYYYLIKKPDKDSFKVEYQSGKASTVKMVTLNPDEAQRVIEAPPSVLARKMVQSVAPLLNHVDTAQWVQVVSDMLRQLDPVNDDENFDPLVRALFLAETLTIICNDPLFEPEFSKWLATFDEDRDFDRFFNWYDTTEKTLGDQRRIAVALLQKLPVSGSLDSKLKAVEARAQNKKADFNIEYDWIGFVNVERSKTLCQTRPGTKGPDGMLYLCRVSPVTSKPELIHAGVWKDNKPVLNETLPELKRGQPVYLRISRQVSTFR